MSAIVLLDTSIYLNVLNVTGRNQNRSHVLKEFQQHIELGSYFLLPLATIWETGNHIAHLADGRLRWKFAQILVADVEKAFNGDAPYRSTYFPEREVFLHWLRAFPEFAQKSKSLEKTTEGTSLADLSIIKEWERVCAQNSMSRVLIWSLDCDLSSYDRLNTK
jgi:hypothetical protein